MKSSDWPQVGDEVELIAVPSGLHPDAAKLFCAGMAGRVSQLHGNHTCDVDFFPSGTLVLETRLLRRRYIDKSEYPVFSKGDKVELIEIPPDLPKTATEMVRVGIVGEVCAMSGDASRVEVELPSGGKLSTLAKHFRRSLPGVTVHKIVPGSTVQCASIQNIHIEVLGEGRTINVPAGQVVDWFDDKSSHTPTSETSRLMSVRLRQAIRRLFDLEKRLQCPGKDAPDHEHLPYIETAARITNDVLAVVDDLNGSIIETVF